MLGVDDRVLARHPAGDEAGLAVEAAAARRARLRGVRPDRGAVGAAVGQRRTGVAAPSGLAVGAGDLGRSPATCDASMWKICAWWISAGSPGRHRVPGHERRLGDVRVEHEAAVVVRVRERPRVRLRHLHHDVLAGRGARRALGRRDRRRCRHVERAAGLGPLHDRGRCPSGSSCFEWRSGTPTFDAGHGGMYFAWTTVPMPSAIFGASPALSSVQCAAPTAPVLWHEAQFACEHGHDNGLERRAVAAVRRARAAPRSGWAP